MAKAKKDSKADFLREWGLPYPSFRYHHLRYTQPPEKGVYWYYFSLYIRSRDVEKYGTCISCGRSITMENSQAGHFMPARDCGRDLLFDERNVNAECEGCNAFDETHLLGYAEGLDERYGAGTADELRAARTLYLNQTKVHGVLVKDWKRDEYAEKIRAIPTFVVPSHDVVLQ